MHKILTKRIEPYILLERLREKCEMKDFTFDGFSKNAVKKEFLKSLEEENTFGLYMKNVNKYYCFKAVVDIDELFSLNSEDYVVTDDLDKPFDAVDMGKAEAGFIIL